MATLRTRAFQWIKEHSLHIQEEAVKNSPYYFKARGLSNHNEIFIRSGTDGLVFGYKAIRWEGPSTPTPCEYALYSLAWETLKSMNVEEQQKMILGLLMDTIDIRKEQYSQCQFCGRQAAVEHRFDNNTCHGCASNHFGIVY